jgi:2-succinyl-6-hydroxy-2,4-cyclohexadiene-1-carboxylate synthase
VLCDYALTPPTDSKTVLVFVHGWLLSRAYWQPVIDLLSPHYQCLAYDLRGFGQSVATAQTVAQSVVEPSVVEPSPVESASVQSGAAQCDYSLESHAQDLLQLLAQLGIQQAWLVGHSLGGAVALWAADLAPDRIAGAVCVNFGGGIYLEQDFAKFRQAGQQMLGWRPGWLRYAPFIDRAFGQMAIYQPTARTWGKQRLEDFLVADREAAKATLLASTTATEVHRLPQIVARLAQPAYFITGDRDSVMPPRYVRHLASFHRSFPEWGANVLELEDCGHFAMLEQSTAVAQYIQSVLQGQFVPACI